VSETAPMNLTRTARWGLAAVAVVAIAGALWTWRRGASREAQPPVPAELSTISPRHLSNQTAYPIVIYGQGLEPGLRLRLVGPNGALTIPTGFLDSRHLTARIPAGLDIPEQRSAAKFEARLVTGDDSALDGTAGLTVVNDLAFAQPYDFAMSPDGQRAFVLSTSTDEVWVQSAAGPGPRVQVGDRPIAAAHYRDGSGRDWLVVAHEYEPALWLLRMDDLAIRRTIPLPRESQGLAIDSASARAYVTNRWTDAVHVVDLAAGRELTQIQVGVNPRAVALGSDSTLCVSNLGSNDASLVSLELSSEQRVTPRQGTPIIGGHTAVHSDHVMGGKSMRALVYSAELNLFFATGIGPNIGPNPQRMEVSMNGGVTVLDPARQEVVRHVSMLRGVPEGIALDPGRGLLYVADIGMGRLVAFDANKLASAEGAATALLGHVEIAPPADTPLLRDAADFGIDGRAGVALHSGPRVVKLAADGRTAYVLSRFLGTISEIDLSKADEGDMTVRATWASHLRPRHQVQRRLGEVAYFTDLGNTRMSCDACHYEGHDDGILFTKGKPMHIYRAPSLRSVAESAPYFTPALFPSLEFTARFVLGRNRFHNPDPSKLEVRALTLYQAAVAAPPNPNRGDDGSLPAEIALPRQRRGSPARGLAVFEGKGECTGCHPPPQFTTDQDTQTRRRLYDVGTPITLDLRAEWQDTGRYQLPAPALVGLWDNYPLLHSGAGGFSVTADGHVLATQPFALDAVLELSAEGNGHGTMGTLDARERADLLAYLLTL